MLFVILGKLAVNDTFIKPRISCFTLLFQTKDANITEWTKEIVLKPCLVVKTTMIKTKSCLIPSPRPERIKTNPRPELRDS